MTSIRRLLCIFLIATPCAPAAEDKENPVIRVMSYNIRHGVGMDKRLDIERIAGVIKESNADIVALQEVDQGVQRSGSRDLPAELAELTGMEVCFERNITFQGGAYGNAVLTRFPIKSKKNTHYQMLHPGEQRGLMQLVLDVRGKDLLFMNTHLDYRPDDSERLLNISEIEQIIANAGKMPVILCGDFNAPPGSPTHRKMSETLNDAWEQTGEGKGFTYPSDKPGARIDYIWISKDSIQPLEIKTPESPASDHLPLIGSFRIR